jgi:protein-S-isoprenylcysteine O-methyltransferase Ste14
MNTSFDIYRILLYTELLSAPLVLILLLRVSAPYGRHNRPGWGPLLDQRISWFLMELPAFILPLLFVFVFLDYFGSWRTQVAAFWLLHYGYRTFVFPLCIRDSRRSFPLLISLMALLFNLMNGYINWYAITVINLGRDAWTAAGIAGAVVFLAGWIIHVSSDRIILRLRGPGKPRYAIPEGGLFRWVSSPQYLGEIIQWCGFALLVGTLAGVVFAIFTIANLLPRAVANHRWYRAQFEDYPVDRKILVPGIF